MSTAMIVIAGHVTVAAKERDRHVERMQDVVRRGRESDGCVHFAVTADPDDPRRVDVVEVWRHRDALAAWRPNAHAPEQPEFESMEMGFYEALPIDPL